MSLDTITFVKGALFSLLGNRLRLKDSQPLATHPRPLASTRLDSRIRTTLRASTLITASGGSPSPRRTRASCRARNLSSPPPLSECVCVSGAAGKQTQHQDSGLGIRLIAGVVRSRGPDDRLLISSSSRRSRRSVEAVQEHSRPTQRPLAGEDIKNIFCTAKLTAKHIVNNMKRIIFLRNRVVPAHAGKLEARGVLDLAEARDGPGTACESTHSEACQKTHPRTFHIPKIPESCHIRYSSRRIDRTRVAQLLKRQIDW